MSTNNTRQLRIIAGYWRGRKIHFSAEKDLRPTPDRVRETVFNWLQADIIDANCLDLFAGSGALGFEAASRGAKRVVMVDNSVKTSAEIRANIQTLQPQSSSIELVSGDALAYLKNNTIKYDVVFLDPPYHSQLLSQICMLLEQEKCLSEHAKIYLEHDKSLALPALPVNWYVKKNKSAGQVSYYLIDRKENE